MIRSITTFGLTVLLTAGVPLGLVPQVRAATGIFADVPGDHRVYQAVDTLEKAGIVIGAQDGNYSGKHEMTRYEFAEGIARFLPLLAADSPNVTAKADFEDKLSANRPALSALHLLVKSFQPELVSLGLNVTAALASIDSLEHRTVPNEQDAHAASMGNPYLSSPPTVTIQPSFSERGSVSNPISFDSVGPSIQGQSLGRSLELNAIESGWRVAQLDDALSVRLGGVSLHGGYDYLGAGGSASGFLTPAIGLKDPSNLEGPSASADFKLAGIMGINLGYANYQFQSSAPKGIFDYPVPLAIGDHIQKYVVGTDLQLGRRNAVNISFEQDSFDLKNNQGSGVPTQSFLTFGLDHRLTRNANFNLTYQIYQYDDRGTGIPDAYDSAGGTQGSTAEGQFSLHF